MPYNSKVKAGLAFCTFLSFQVSGTHTASAQDYCASSFEPGLNLGCARTLVEASILSGAFNPANSLINTIIGSYDGLIFDSDWIANSKLGNLRFDGNVKFTRDFNSSWANIYFGSARTDGGKTAFDVTAFNFRDTVTGHTTVELLFDRLTLENTALTLRDGASDTGRQTGDISYLLIGDGAVGRGGVLALRNASLTFEDSTDLYMAAPGGGTPVIRAESGNNLLKLGDQSTRLNRLSVVVDDGANLTFDGTAIAPRTEGNLTVGLGASLNVENNSVLALVSNVGSSLPRTTVNGGTVTVDGLLSDLRLTAPSFNDSTVSLENGGILRIEQRNGVRSTLSFSGDSTLNFGSPQAAVLGADANPQAMILAVGAGTTKITNTGGVNNLGRGLQVDQVRIDGGTLDTTGYSVRDDVTDAWLYLSVENGGTFYDRAAFYHNIDRLIVDGGTLQTHSSFGKFSGGADGIENALFTNSTIDLVSSSSMGSTSGNVSTGLRSVVLNAQNLAFSGTNKVMVGISPAGECVAGICTPGTTIYAGELFANVGGSPTSTLTGFDTVLFVPSAIDANAVAADYIAGGNNGIYTVARANNNPDLTFNVQSFDAAPVTPTVALLMAAGSDLPANLTYVIVNNPVADGRVDISFVDVTLQNHPLVAASYTEQFTNAVVVEPTTNNVTAVTVSILPDHDTEAPNSWTLVEPTTENITTITQTAVLDPIVENSTQVITTVVTEPDGNNLSTETVTVPLDPNSGGAVQLITTTVTEPDGDHIQTTTVAVPLDKATGTTNTANYGNLLYNSNASMTHGGLGGVETLHPEAYASYMTVALEHSDHLRNIVLGNARGNISGGTRTEGLTGRGSKLWLDSAVIRGNVNEAGGLAGFSYKLGEIVLGGDLWSNEKTKLGAYVGYGLYSMSEHSSSTSSLDFSSKAFQAGAFGTYDVPNWSVTGMAGFSWADTEATREAITSSGSNIHKADYNSRTFEAGVRAEYTGFFPAAKWSLAPEIGLGYSHFAQNTFTETGASATALTIKEKTAESLVGGIGLNLSGPDFGVGIIPLAFLRYEYDFLASRDRVHQIDASFATTPGISQSFVGTHRGPDAVSFGIGLRSAPGKPANVSAGLIYTKNTHGDEFGGGIRVTWAY